MKKHWIVEWCDEFCTRMRTFDTQAAAEDWAKREAQSNPGQGYTVYQSLVRYIVSGLSEERT